MSTGSWALAPTPNLSRRLADPVTRHHQRAAIWLEATTGGVRLAAPTDDHAALMYSRIIAQIGQLSCFPGLLSPFPGSDMSTELRCGTPELAVVKRR